MAKASALGDPLRALFDRARGGDERALEQLCIQTRPRLYRAAYAVLRDADEADDIAQLALIKTLAQPFLFLGRGSVSGWMTRIAVNLARNRLRDARRRKEIMEQALPDEKSARGAEASAAPDPERMALDNDAREKLLEVVMRLPDRQRDVMLLHVVAQLDFAEVAVDLAITELNARVTYWHAKKKLAKVLGP
jgi:RNA polymerase sigma-70 factor (ECF subfamily)